MLKKLLATTALFALPFSASAADMGPRNVYKAPMAEPVPVFNWTGFYVGGHIGGVWSSFDFVDNHAGSPIQGLTEATAKPNGFLGGLQVGYNFQFAPSWVIGIQGDIAWTDASGTTGNIFAPEFSRSGKMKWVSTITPRIGYTWDRFLVYVKGGVAFAKYEASQSSDIFNYYASWNGNRTGWTVGAGGEYAITQNLSAFVEYNHLDFGSKNVDFSDNMTGSYPYIIRDTTADTVKAGLNWRL